MTQFNSIQNIYPKQENAFEKFFSIVIMATNDADETCGILFGQQLADSLAVVKVTYNFDEEENMSVVETSEAHFLQGETIDSVMCEADRLELVEINSWQDAESLIGTLAEEL